MKILYGVQGTGNGHITRARSMATEFRKADIDVDYLFSGRPRDQLFDMQPFGDYRHRRGLTFAWRNGKIDQLRTLTNNNLFQFVRDARNLDLTGYDLVVTDFEPVTAWAAKIQNKPSLGIGHQYAFKYKIPSAGHNFVTRLLMKYFAPAQRSLGVHWHHFDEPILPPLIERPTKPSSYDKDKILVYLPFEELDSILEWLSGVSEKQFYIYHHVSEPKDNDHLHIRPFDRKAFQSDLASCSGVIANAGFGLLSESIQYGKKLLVKPVQGQMEQLSNAVALEELSLGLTMHEYDTELLYRWLKLDNPKPHSYPQVARGIVEWIQAGLKLDEIELAKSLWSNYPQPNIRIS